MFSFGKSRYPANWPPLHHKCNQSKCTFPNHPQPAAGTYKCRGCDKGIYTVSNAQAQEADAQGRNVFYVPGRSPPLNARIQRCDLSQEFPPYIPVAAPKRDARPNPISTRVAPASNAYSCAPAVYDREGSSHQASTSPSGAYNQGMRPNLKQENHSSSGSFLSAPSKKSSSGSFLSVDPYAASKASRYTRSSSPDREAQAKPMPRRYRVVNV
ncbi:hypothetical protein D9757_002514 [Collybiopsis confluens]|uniref:Uncharacterized protein n=1 Tax=Collybiopsis confluens TaxID=2823264 RepID=A0A8H5HY29_9AGAR|nr:hypothetical protein D9757_002514 [Collybiopsis confluens]